MWKRQTYIRWLGLDGDIKGESDDADGVAVLHEEDETQDSAVTSVSVAVFSASIRVRGETWGSPPACSALSLESTDNIDGEGDPFEKVNDEDEDDGMTITSVCFL